jgi:DNA replication initiation complex subunit (GINS family)
MGELISYEEIRRVQIKERDNKGLQELDPSFFDKVKEYIKSKKKLIDENKDKDNIFSKQIVEKNQQELRNVEWIIEDICSRRRRKVVTQALNNISARVHNTENMLPEEEQLYNEVIEVVKKYTSLFLDKFKSEISGDEPERKDLKKLKIMESLPAFMWKDNKQYGPYEKDEVVELPSQLGEILINEGKAIEME